MKELPCWTIMSCGNQTCAARRYYPQQQCWEIVHELEDYRAEFNVCADCLVYVLKTDRLAIPAHHHLHHCTTHTCPLSR